MSSGGQAVRIGGLTTIAEADDDRLRSRTDRLRSQGYEVQRTGHFVVCRRPSEDDGVVLLHTFHTATVDEDISPMVAEELGSVGLVGSAEEYGRALFAIVVSTCPPSLRCPDCGRLHLDDPGVWRHYCVNTLKRLRLQMEGTDVPTTNNQTHVERFGTIYRRISAELVGSSLLDVGCNLGFLPVLMAEWRPAIAIVACDNRSHAVAIAADLAQTTVMGSVRFVVQDVLAPDFRDIGLYETVTAVHLLEHLTDDEIPVALANLLDVARRRLILAVPFEEKVQPLFGHTQAFTPAKLESWARWCIGRLGGGRYRCENVEGGMLVLDLRPE